MQIKLGDKVKRESLFFPDIKGEVIAINHITGIATLQDRHGKKHDVFLVEVKKI